MSTLQEFVTMTEGVSYLIAIGFALSFIGFWRFLTAREAPAHALAHVLVPERVPWAGIPGDVFFHPKHAWASLEASGAVRMGVDHFLQNALGRVDAIELPAVGEVLTAGQPAFALVQGARRAAVPSAVSGVVTEVNQALARAPAMLADNEGFGAAWAVRVAPTQLSEELPRLRVADAARAWLQREGTRLRDLVVTSAGEHAALGATMADGGELSEGPLEHVDDATWTAFFAGDED